MPEDLIRIVSDIHYADRSSRVAMLDQLRPVFGDVGSLVLNGDTLDTRPGSDPGARAEVLEWLAKAGPAVTILTGNHDPDLSSTHRAEFAEGSVFVTHGDILFDSIVPWSKDAGMIRPKIIAGLAALPSPDIQLDDRLKVFRAVSASIPQRHHSERRPLRYALQFFGDTVWPPSRALKVLQAWRQVPLRAAALARRHRPKARFVLIGHTHRPGLWTTPEGLTIINTGAFCRPFASWAVDISPGELRVRRIERKNGEFRPGATVARFPLP